MGKATRLAKVQEKGKRGSSFVALGCRLNQWFSLVEHQGPQAEAEAHF